MATAVLAGTEQYGRVVRGPEGGVGRIVEARDAGPDERLLDQVGHRLLCVQCSACSARCCPRLEPGTPRASSDLIDVIDLALGDGEQVEAHIAADAEVRQAINRASSSRG